MLYSHVLNFLIQYNSCLLKYILPQPAQRININKEQYTTHNIFISELYCLYILLIATNCNYHALCTDKNIFHIFL